MAKASVIVINYNGKNFTRDCLKALGAQSFKDFEIVIVDNGSSDGSLQEIRSCAENLPLRHPFKIIPLGINKGFAGGNMAALAHAESRYVALLNNDTEPDKDWIGNLVAAMDANPAIGICASKMLVFGTNQMDSAGDGFSTALKGYKRGEGLDSGSYSTQEYIFGACAGAALYRREMLNEIGFLDEDFFLIHEDSDLNFRAQLAGWKVFYVPTAIVQHKVRSTIGTMSDTAVYYTLRNSEFVRIKNIPFGIFLKSFPAFVLGMMSEFIYFAIRHKRPGLYCKAKKDVIRNLGKMLSRRKSIMAMKKVDDKYLCDLMTPVWNREFFTAKIRKLFFG